MSKKDQLFRVIAALDNHFAADDQSPANVDRWRALKRHIARMKDALDLARIELERTTPETGEALNHIRWGLGVEK
jgi:hypothetical protein